LLDAADIDDVSWRMTPSAYAPYEEARAWLRR